MVCKKDFLCDASTGNRYIYGRSRNMSSSNAVKVFDCKTNKIVTTVKKKSTQESRGVGISKNGFYFYVKSGTNASIYPYIFYQKNIDGHQEGHRYNIKTNKDTMYSELQDYYNTKLY